MELFADPVMLGVMKVVGSTIAFVAGIPFIIGIVLGWFIHGMTR